MKRLVHLILCLLAIQSSAQNYTVTSQEELDNWSITSVNSIVIEGPNITSLTGLSVLTEANSLVVRNTFELTSLSGLENFPGDISTLRIQNNQSLEDASSIENISSQSLVIEDNPLLSTIGEYQGSENMDDAILTNNPLLSLSDLFSDVVTIQVLEYEGASFDGFNSLEYAATIYMDTPEMSGLGNLTTAAEIFSFNKAYYPALEEVFFLKMEQQALVQNFSGFPNVVYASEIQIDDVADAFSFEGLSSIQSIDRITMISGTYGASFSGLDNITEMEALSIDYWDGDLSLEGLNSLQSLSSLLRLVNCQNLNTLSGLNSLNYTQNIIVTSNGSLVLCCDLYEGLQSVNVIVHSNANEQCNDISLWSLPCGTLAGCTDEGACNYDPGANEDDGSCIISGTPCDDNNLLTENDQINQDCECQGEAFELIWGCTYEAAPNYNPEANMDDGSCDFVECITGDLDGDQLVGVEDLLILLQNFGNAAGE